MIKQVVLNPKKYYTIINCEGKIIFSGNVNDAVEQGISGTVSAFRSFISSYRGINVVKSRKPFNQKYLHNLNVTRCLLEAGCKMYSDGSITPCCYDCSFRDGCRERCKNTKDKCGCGYHGSNIQGWEGECISNMEP